jgi:hypothetical protein
MSHCRYWRILKLTLLVSGPLGVVTTTLPVVAPLGTTAVMYGRLAALSSTYFEYDPVVKWTTAAGNAIEVAGRIYD